MKIPLKMFYNRRQGRNFPINGLNRQIIHVNYNNILLKFTKPQIILTYNTKTIIFGYSEI